METIEAIKARRAVKNYDPAHQLSDEEEGQLIDLAMQAPSSYNIQHWRLVKVSDKELRRHIRQAAWDQAQVSDASLLFVLCADVKAWEKEPQRYWRNAPKEVQDFLLPTINPFYAGKEQLQRDEAMRSVGLVAQTIMLAAKDMGYDSCPMIGFDAQKVAQLIKLPQDHVIGMLLVVGKALTPARPKGGFIEKSQMVIENHF